MFAIGGVLLIISAFYVGVPAKVYLDDIATGQILLVIGTAFLTWELLNTFKRHINIIPLLIGLAIVGYFGIYHEDLWGVVGGIPIITVWEWNRRKRSNRPFSKRG